MNILHILHGLAGHGSAPDKGVNAVEYATKFINKLMDLREELKKREPKNSIFTPPYTTLQIGRIKGGISKKCNCRPMYC